MTGSANWLDLTHSRAITAATQNTRGGKNPTSIVIRNQSTNANTRSKLVADTVLPSIEGKCTRHSGNLDQASTVPSWLVLVWVISEGSWARLPAWKALALGILFSIRTHAQALRNGSPRTQRWVLAELTLIAGGVAGSDDQRHHLAALPRRGDDRVQCVGGFLCRVERSP